MKTSHELKGEIAKLQAERAGLARQGAEALLTTDGDAAQKALGKQTKRALEIQTTLGALEAALAMTEAREAEERKERRVTMCEVACDHLLEEALAIPAAARELQAAVSNLEQKLTQLQVLRDRMAACVQVAAEHSHVHQGAELRIADEVNLSALVDPFVRALERAGLGTVGLNCHGALELAPSGPGIPIADAAEIVIDRLIVRINDLVEWSKRTIEQAPKADDPRLARNPKEPKGG